MAKNRELTKSAERRKVAEQNKRAEENPVAAWKTNAGTKPLKQTSTALDSGMWIEGDGQGQRGGK